MSMIENTFKLKHKAVEKIVKYSNQMSLRTKIRQGYIVMIILFFFIFVLVVGLEIRNYSGKIIYSTMENQNQQIEKSIDYFIDDIIKLSEYPYVDSEVTALLEKSYQGDGESIVVKINDTAKLAHLLYKHVFYMNKRIDSVWLLAENNMENPAIVTRQNLNNHYNMKEEDWYNRVYSGNGTPFILGVHEDSGSTSNEKIVSVARSIVSPTDGSFLGMFVINIKANDFAALWYNGQADDRIIAVADKENHLIMNPNAAKEDDLETYIQSVDAKMPVNKRQTVAFGNENLYKATVEVTSVIPANSEYFDLYREQLPDLAPLVDYLETSQPFAYPTQSKKFADRLISLMQEALMNEESTLTGQEIVTQLAEEFGNK